MTRSILVACALCLVLFSGQAYAHDEDGHGENPLGCDPAAGEACYYAVADDFHANPSTTDSMGEIFLALNSARTELRYLIVLDDLLGLKPNPEDRTEPDDILGMHLHVHVDGDIGPHVLNIFGWATPTITDGYDDDDLVVDYEHHTLRGIYDMSDATIDPETGQPFPAIHFATTKAFDFGVFVLERNEMVFAVHTVESGFRNYAIHGHIHPVVPEPTTGFLLVCGALLALVSRSGVRKRTNLFLGCDR